MPDRETQEIRILPKFKLPKVQRDPLMLPIDLERVQIKIENDKFSE